MAVETAVAGRAGARAWTFARAVPIWAWLVGLVVVSTGIRYAFTRHAVAPWIMVDELIYSELAKSFASGGHFLVRDHSTAAYGVVYPVLISPAWAIFKAVPAASPSGSSTTGRSSSSRSESSRSRPSCCSC